MSKIIADRMMVDDDEMHFRDADAQNKLKNLIVQEKGDSENAVMSQKAATKELAQLSEEIVIEKNTLLKADELENSLINDGLCDVEFTFVNGYVDTNTGELSDLDYSGYYNRTNYIPIPPNCNTIKHNMRSDGQHQGWAFYDENRKVIATDLSNTLLEVPNGAKYIALSDCSEPHDDRKLMFFTNNHTQKSLNHLYSDISDSFIYSSNLVDKENGEVVHGGYYNISGDFVENPDYHQSGYIRVEYGKKYTSNYTGAFVLWYDKSRNLIGSTPSQEFEVNGYVTPIKESTYGRFITTNSYYDNWQVSEGEELPSYEPYYKKLKKEFLYGDDLGDNLENIKFTSYGDSIVFRNTWQPYLINKYGFAHTNLGIGSTTMAYKEDIESETPCMVNQARIQDIKDSNPDLLIIMAGTNDAHYKISIGEESQLSNAITDKDKTTFIGAYSYLIETLLTWKPTLRFILMNPMHSVYEAQNYFDYNPYAEAVRTIAKYYGLNVADTNKYSCISKFDYTTYTVDGLHPNDEGGKIIANIVNREIVGMYSLK